jgi:hypothetical protein
MALNIKQPKAYWEHIALAVFSGLVLLPFLGEVHLFDWDEINFAESAREMLVSGNFLSVQIDYEPFWEKPPLFFWLQAMSLKLFSDPEFAARFPNAIAGIISLQVLLWISRRHQLLKNHLFWPLIYLSSLTPFFYFKSGIIDPWFNLWIFLAVYFLYRAASVESFRSKGFALSGLMLGLAFLTKGPVAILLTGLCGFVYWMLLGFRKWFGAKDLLLLILFMLLVPFFWLLPEIMERGGWFMKTFIEYQLELLTQPVASHGQPWFYHLVVLLFGAFPASVIALPRLIKRRKVEHGFELWLLILFWVVLVVFSSVTTKIVHYSSLCFLPLTFMAAKQLEWYPNRFQSVLLFTIAFVLSISLSLLPYMMTDPDRISWLKSVIDDRFVQAQLSVPGIWRNYMLLSGPLVLASLYLVWRNWKSGQKLTQALLLLPMVWLLVMHWFVPSVERHTQYPVVSFYKAHAQEQAYFIPYRFKTYAHLFYGEVMPLKEDDPLLVYRRKWKLRKGFKKNEVLTGDARKKLADEESKWLIDTPQEKNVYFICVERKAKELEEFDTLKEVMRSAGYVIFKKVE